MEKEINTNLNYIGSVDLSLTINNKKIVINKHNSGLPDLFRLISKALAGYDITKEKIAYIDLRYSKSDDPDIFNSCLTKKQSISQLSYLIENGCWITKAASSIPYASLIVSPISALGAYSFRIYLMTKSVDLAFIEIDEKDLLKLVPGTQALVEWVLKISNSF
jgi:hypothetical protein